MRKEGHHHHEHGKVIKALNLTEAQQQQLKANNESFREQMKALDKNEGITVKESRDRKEALVKDKKAKFEALLTPEQKAKLETFKKERTAKHDSMSAKRLEKMKVTLSLSDKQVTALKAHKEATHAKLKAIKENEQLSRTERQAQIAAIREANKNSFKTILTPEQLTKWQELKKQKMDRRSI
ncbi:MAG: hypothetical protein HY305_06270 [Sphingobacteriales bacterium]|nr:hypothetical protein [Sphingobacteriales bacterium]